MKSASKFATVLGLALAGSMVLAASAAYAESPAPKEDITGKTLYLTKGSWLRYSDALISRVYTTTKATLEVKGRDACTKILCPVYHNKVELWALRSRLEVKKPDTGVVVTERTLRNGDDGADVKLAQEALVKAGFKLEKVDGKYRGETQKAIEAFQAKNNINVDGEIGPETRTKLKL